MIPFLAAAIPTAGIMPLVRSWLLHRENLDHPNERSSHSVPTPRGGGLACAVGGASGSVVARILVDGPSREWIAASAVLGGIGWVDDVRGLSPLPRLGGQILIGAAVGARAGGRPGSVFGAVAFPAIVNAFNFMDGINGISGGTAFAWGCCVGSDDTLTPQQRTQGLLVAGMGAGFLPYNSPRALIFLGDTGSYLLGAAIAVTTIESTFSRKQLCLPGSLSVIGPLVPYLADTGTTIARRIVRRDAITKAHREHVYQRLVHEFGLSHSVVASFVAFSSILCGTACRPPYRPRTAIVTGLGYLVSPEILRIFRDWGFSHSPSEAQKLTAFTNAHSVRNIAKRHWVKNFRTH